MAFCNVLLDLILVFIVAWGIISGWRRGFVKVVFMKMKRLTSIVIACLLAKPIGNLLKDKLFLEPMTVKIRELLGEALGTDAVTATTEEMTENLPLVLRGILNLVGIDIAEKAAEATEAGGNLLDSFTAGIAEPAARVVGVIAAFIIVYFICRLFLRVLVALVNGIFNLPGLRIVNKVLGLVFGLTFSAAFAWIIVAVIGFFGDLLTNSSIAFFEKFNIMETWLAKFVYQFKPIDFIFSIK